MKYKFEDIVFFFFMGMVAASIFLGIRLSAEMLDNAILRKSAVENGYAEWVIDQGTGSTIFKFKKSERGKEE